MSTHPVDNYNPSEVIMHTRVTPIVISKFIFLVFLIFNSLNLQANECGNYLVGTLDVKSTKVIFFEELESVIPPETLIAKQYGSYPKMVDSTEQHFYVLDFQSRLHIVGKVDQSVRTVKLDLQYVRDDNFDYRKIVLSPDNKLLALIGIRTVVINLETMRPIADYRIDGEFMEDLVFIDDVTFISLDRNGGLYKFNYLKSNTPERVKVAVNGATSSLVKVDGHVIIHGAYGELIKVDIDTLDVAYQLRRMPEDIENNTWHKRIITSGVNDKGNFFVLSEGDINDKNLFVQTPDGYHKVVYLKATTEFERVYISEIKDGFLYLLIEDKVSQKYSYRRLNLNNL